MSAPGTAPSKGQALGYSVDFMLTVHRARIIKILDITVAIAALATVPITVLELRDYQNAWILVADWLIWLVFVAEYVVMLRLPPDEGGFFGSRSLDGQNWKDWRNWVSVAIIVLSFPLLGPLFQLVRLVRVVRLARLGRIVMVATKALGHTAGRRGVLYVSGIVILAILLGGILITSVDPDAVGSTDVLSGIWWASVTTIGTGISGSGPTNGAGNAIALVLILCGVAFVTTLAGSIAAYFLVEDETELSSVHKRLDDIHALVSRSEDPASSGDPETKGGS